MPRKPSGLRFVLKAEFGGSWPTEAVVGNLTLGVLASFVQGVEQAHVEHAVPIAAVEAFSEVVLHRANFLVYEEFKIQTTGVVYGRVGERPCLQGRTECGQL